jgi:hypothetical protein
MIAVAAHSVGAVDRNREFDGPLVTVEFRREVMLNLTAPPFGEFLLNLISPCDDWNHVGVVVRLHQRETLAVVEFAIDVEGLDFKVEVIDEARLRNSARTLLAVGLAATPLACSVLHMA